MKLALIACGFLIALSATFAQTSTGSQTTTGPCSPIFNGSGNTNNCVPPSRHISDDYLKQGTEFLTPFPAKVLILYVSTDTEAYNYAAQIASMLKASGWTVDGPNGAMIFTGGGGPPLSGVEVAYKGDSAAPNTQISIDFNTSWGRLAAVLSTIQGHADLTLQPSPSMKENEVNLTVYANPKAKPQ